MRKRAFFAGWVIAVSTPVLAAASFDRRSDPLTGMPFVLIPAGEFEMGTPVAERQREAQETLHHVKITRPFYLGIHEVTQREWRTVLSVCALMLAAIAFRVARL